MRDSDSQHKALNMPKGQQRLEKNWRERRLRVRSIADRNDLSASVRQLGVIIILASLLVAVFGFQRDCDAHPATHPATSLAAANQARSANCGRISCDTAIDLIMKIPEANEWSIAVQKAGRNTAFIIEDNQTVATKDGHEYWPVNVYEDTDEKLTRWMTFMVQVDGKCVLVEDDLSESDENALITLQQWRTQMKRIESDNCTE